jgi:hypothetical protein
MRINWQELSEINLNILQTYGASSHKLTDQNLSICGQSPNNAWPLFFFIRNGDHILRHIIIKDEQ